MGADLPGNNINMMIARPGKIFKNVPYLRHSVHSTLVRKVRHGKENAKKSRRLRNFESHVVCTARRISED